MATDLEMVYTSPVNALFPVEVKPQEQMYRYKARRLNKTQNIKYSKYFLHILDC